MFAYEIFWYSLWLLLEVIAFFVSTFGNSVVIFVMTRSMNLARKTKSFIISIAIVDWTLGFCSIGLTVIRAVDYIGGVKIDNPTLCKFMTTSMLALISTLFLNVVAVATDRYWAICHPVSYRNRSIRSVLVAIVTCWTLGIIVGVSLLLNCDEKSCFFSQITDKLEFSYFDVLSIVILVSAFMMMFFYSCIYIALGNQVNIFKISLILLFP